MIVMVFAVHHSVHLLVGIPYPLIGLLATKAACKLRTILYLSSAVLVLCLNLGRTYTFHCRRKRQADFEMVGRFLVNVRFWSALALTLKISGVQGTRITAYQHLYSVHVFNAAHFSPLTLAQREKNCRGNLSAES